MLTSIGTETPYKYSITSEIPVPMHEKQDRKRENISISKLIANALEKNIVVAECIINDILEKYDFEPDVSGGNILHFLVRLSKTNENANNILKKILTSTHHKEIIKIYLNQEDNSDETPLVIAINLGKHDLATLMISCGASRKLAGIDIVTDYDTSERNAVAIFARPVGEKRQITDIPKGIENMIAAIVKDFKTMSELDTSPNIFNSSALPHHINVYVNNKPFIDPSKLNEDLASDKFIKIFASKLTGGGKKKSKKNKKNKRKLKSYSENYSVNDNSEKSEKNDFMRRIARATNDQANKFHDEAIAKIKSLLPSNNNDEITAKAVKAIIYDEIKNTRKELTFLDKAAELLKAITKDKVADALSNKSRIKEIMKYIEDKQKTRSESDNDKKNKKSSKKTSSESGSVKSFDSSYFDS
jgi:hypothetical protein